MRMFKARSIFVTFILSIVVEANFLAAIGLGIEPIILSVGSAFVALNLDALDAQPPEGLHFWKEIIGLKVIEGLIPWGKKINEKIKTSEEVKKIWRITKKGTLGIVDKVDEYLGEVEKDVKFESSIESMRELGI